MAVEISVIIPVYNNASSIGELHRRLAALLQPITGPEGYELIFINDGSRDDSLAMMQGMAAQDPAHVRYLSFSRNFGHQIAVTAGLDRADGQAIVIMDADLQDPPELVPLLYARLHEGYEVVYARRRSRQGETVLKKFTAKMFYRLLRALTAVDIPLDTGDFRIISRKVLLALRQMPEQTKFLRGQISWIGYRQTHLDYDRAEREGGTTGYTFFKLLRFALDGITAFSDVPLKAASVGGFMVSGVAFLVMLYALYSRVVHGHYQSGWPSLMVSILFLGGVQLIAVGIIGEYLARLGADVRRRPLYIVSEGSFPEPAPDPRPGM